MCNVYEVTDRIRDLINMPRKQKALLADNVDWNKLCTSLDVLGDTDLAVDSYLAYGIDPKDDGGKYLFAYGVLQALFLQQDATQHLHEALDLEYEPPPSLNTIRGIRNDSVGHPTKRGKGRGNAFSFISRITLCRDGFQLLTAFASGADHFRSIRVPELIVTQREVIVDLLNKVVEQLKHEERDFRNMQKKSKLSEHFPGTLGYCFGKLYEYAGTPDMFTMARGLLGEISDAVDSFRRELRSRGVEGAYTGVEIALEELQYPLDELQTYFSGGEAYLNQRSARIFLDYVRGKCDELLEMAKEIDEEMEQEI